MKTKLLVMFCLCFSFVLFAQEKITQRKSEDMLYPMVRIKAALSTGSDTVLYSEDREKDGSYESFVLTNEHVIDGAIKIEKKWSNLLGRYEDQEVLERVKVEVFRYNQEGKEDGVVVYDADIVAYEADEDLALLQLVAGTKIDYVAKMLPDSSLKPMTFDTVYAVGCSLGHPPIHTKGEITSINETIERRCYWMISAPIIFGNSGGSVFVERNDGFFWIGVPSRLAVASNGQPITHMAFIIPPSRIKSWFEKQKLTFLLDSNVFPSDSFKQRDGLRNNKTSVQKTPTSQPSEDGSTKK